MSTAGYKNGILWLAASEDNVNYALYSFDCLNGTLNMYRSFGSVCKVRRSSSFESFILSVSEKDQDSVGTYVFDISTAALIPVDIGDRADIAVKNDRIFVRDEETVYLLGSDGTLSVTDEKVNFVKHPESRYGVVSSDTEKIIVAEKNEYRWS